MKKTIYAKLSTMMFLEFFIWGSWFVTLGTFLNNNLSASDAESSVAFSTQSWGAIIAPFIIGLIADRFFNAERILGILHLIGAVLMYQMYQAEDFSTFYPYVLGYMIAYMPTLALVNSISFNQMKNPAKEFSYIRVWGTVGWVVAGVLISLFAWDLENSIAKGLLANTFLVTSIASFVLGIFSFLLPKTPPKNRDAKVSISDILGLDALKLLKRQEFLGFLSIVCLDLHPPLAFYYQNTNPFLTEINAKIEILGIEIGPTGIMATGQVSEVLFMLLLPIFFKKYGFKKTILVGMIAWAVRYLLFAYGNSGELLFML